MRAVPVACTGRGEAHTAARLRRFLVIAAAVAALGVSCGSAQGDPQAGSRTLASDAQDSSASDVAPTAERVAEAIEQPVDQANPVAEATEEPVVEQSESAQPTADTSERVPDPTPTPEPAPAINPTYFETRLPGSPLPSDQACAEAVRATPLPETHPSNSQANQIAGGPAVRIDGADEQFNDWLAPRITGNFTGTTEELIRWVACKWGFDEDITRARAWTESSWQIDTQGDETDFAPDCELLALATPCFQSYGLLQVKGTVHEGTFPYAHTSTAWGLDYAMAWQRACFEGAFSWLVDDGYTAGDVNGCVGAWYSGEWFDDLSVTYLADVGANLNNRPWE